MGPRLLARRLHKWLALLIGAQVVIWAVSGFYMVAVHIDIIHGDMLVREVKPTLGEQLQDLVPVSELLERYPGTMSLTLLSRGDRPVYRLNGTAGKQMADARTGDPTPRLTAGEAEEFARRHFTGDAPAAHTVLIEADPPGEIQQLPLPVWQVNFDDAWGTSFYIDPGTGKLLIRRHTLWRIFDFFWMLHIMDYDAREDINNSLLRIVAGLSVLFGITGAWLLYLRFLPKRARG